MTAAAKPGIAKTLCLNMIVKNEGGVIRRCLESVKGIIDYWVICDTGSTDNTIEVIRETLREIPGELHHSDWVNFAHNRTRALELAKEKADYLLLMDADMTAVIHAPFNHILRADSYLIRYEGSLDYQQTMLVSTRHLWHYVGVTHEYIHSLTAITREPLPQLTLTHHADGGTRHDKFSRDIRLLEQGLEAEPHNVRYMFYLAQSYRDSGDIARALKWYRTRAEMGGWDEEVWYSLYQAARMEQNLGEDEGVFVKSYLKAFEIRPTRVEPLYELVKYYREKERYQTAYLFALRAMKVSYPRDVLFIEKSVYEYLLPFEYGICCYYVGEHREAVRVNTRILHLPGVPSRYLDQAEQNRQFSFDTAPSLYPALGRRVLALYFDMNTLGGAPVSLRQILAYLERHGARVRQTPTLPTPQELRDWSPEIIISQQFAVPHGHRLAAALHIPFVMMVHGPGQYEQFFSGEDGCDLVIFNSHHQEQLVKQKHPGLNSFVLYPVVPPEDYNPGHEEGEGDEMAEKGTGEKIKKIQKITMIGSEPHKGRDIFIEIARHLPELDFLLVGEIDPEEMASELPKNIELMGRTKDIVSVYRRTRVLVMPSAVESYGRAAVEAATWGIPVIATDLPGIREATENDKAVYIKDRQDIGAWIGAIKEVLQHPELYRRRARELVQLKHPEADLSRLMEVLLQIIEKSKKRQE